MAGVNKVILLGNLGNDPEIRTVGTSKVASFSLATSEAYNNKEGVRVEQTEWHRVEIWGNLAETVEKYVKKGSSLYVEGKIKTDEYTDKDGVAKKIVKIRGTSITLVGSKPDDLAKQAPQPAVAPPQSAPVAMLPSSDDNSDLPF